MIHARMEDGRVVDLPASTRIVTVVFRSGDTRSAFYSPKQAEEALCLAALALSGHDAPVRLPPGILNGGLVVNWTEVSHVVLVPAGQRESE